MFSTADYRLVVVVVVVVVVAAAAAVTAAAEVVVVVYVLYAWQAMLLTYLPWSVHTNYMNKC
jgi:hypothetical protein